MTADLPSPLDLPDADTIAQWHDDLVAAAEHGQAAGQGPVRTLRISGENTAKAQALARTLDDLVRAYQAAMSARWIETFRRALIKGDPNPWCDRLRERIEEWGAVDAERVKLLRRSVELPDGLIDNADACEAVSRAAKGQKLWPLMALGKGTAKALVGAILVDGATLREEDIEGWRHAGAVIANTVRQRQVRARWDAFAKEIGAPVGSNAKSAVDLAVRLVRICDDARGKSALLASLRASL